MPWNSFKKGAVMIKIEGNATLSGNYKEGKKLIKKKKAKSSDFENATEVWKIRAKKEIE